jgi:signal transduction histidine kinase
MADNLKFKVSSSLKTIIGRDLITDDFIAVFELVKNSFDAGAKNVSIEFKNLGSHDASIVISDDGDGMSKSDILDKWLFVAYSSKRDQLVQHKEEDYRQKIQSSRLYAGAKGVGRFSCDRLGAKLRLATCTAERQVAQVLEIDWDLFEKNPLQSFLSVPIQHSTQRKEKLGIRHGTVLTITTLRDTWDRNKLLRLRRSLEKLVNPYQRNDSANFRIKLIAHSETEADKNTANAWEKVNGPIRNTLLEKLGLRTTQLEVIIDRQGKTRLTRLTDRGTVIYEMTEVNKQALLKDVHIHIFHLGTEAKKEFKRLMGLHSVEYGSIFLYKNGFRIYPYGEEGNDAFGLDRRKQQGTRRYLGTRDIIGRIELNGISKGLNETSSRDGGLIRTAEYDQLTELLVEVAIKRLEKYVVDAIRWGVIQVPSYGLRGDSNAKAVILDIIASLTNSEDVLSIDFDSKLLKVLNERQARSTSKLLANLSRVAEQSNDDQLQRDVRRAELQLRELSEARNEAEAEAERNRTVALEAERALERTVSENIFLRGVASADNKELIALQHQVGHSVHLIDQWLFFLKDIKGLSRDAIPAIERIAFETKKIHWITKYVTQARFNLKVVSLRQDLKEFVVEYIENVYKAPPKYTRARLPEITTITTGDQPFTIEFRPLDIIVVLDNLLSNARKADARNIRIHLHSEDGVLRIAVSDDGRGIPARLMSSIFEFGFTTTDGSGIGLYHVQEVVQELGGTVEVESDGRSGSTFTISLKK